MNEQTCPSQPRIIEFGPRRIIGMSYRGKNENREIPQFWERVFLPRESEITRPEGVSEAFGICRCIPGVTDGTFEYIAAFAAAQDAPVPEGMMAFEIPQHRYAAFRAEDLSQIGQAWQETYKWIGESTEWETYCSPKGCECATRPGFEYYPPEFGERGGPIFIHIPLKSKA